MIKIKALLILLCSVFLLSACSDDDDDKPVSTIVDVAVADGNFTTLVTALQTTGLDVTLSDVDATFTVFAPTDDAFALLGEDTINALLADADALSNILTYHVINGQVAASAALNAVGTEVEMVNGDFVGLSLDGDDLLVNTATVVTTDIQTDNGIIHVIDAVLIPPTAKGNPTSNIVETAVADGRFTTLVAALEATQLDTVLADPDAVFTVFAPTDAAFEMVGEENIALLLDNPNVLASILLQHVVAGIEVDSVTAYTLNGTEATTAAQVGIPVGINSSSDVITFGGANVVIKDVYASNGVIHVIDAVVIGDVELPEPPMSLVDVAIENGNFTTLVAALQATGLDVTLGDFDTNYTVFAPNDDAFAKLPEGTVDALLADTEKLSDILLYHVLSGRIMSDAAITAAQTSGNQVATANTDALALSYVDSSLYVNNSLVTATDVMADNGVIHVVDTVLMPPVDAGEPTESIVDVAVADERFTTLVDALTAANLVDTLANEEATFTVFAPTNDAFDKIDSAELSALLANTEALREVLLQHVIGGEVNSVAAYAANGRTVPTASGNEISVSIDPTSRMLQFGGANVIITDIYTTNGIIHVIDTVVLD
ncbi:fasciclin domain-containing protein [Psychrosphaera aestuarii]|uniref:fasciclin domain-containing protein n=1 Tax=Psychrosphaera aestuarii TaxID=1266052 RepID=UPI001FD29EDA|nr:fasciclin domain-containing protein [Psychrosphaera aestuarii]